MTVERSEVTSAPSWSGLTPTEPGQTRPLILIVERDHNVRDLQSFFLERAGFSVEFAEDGEVALAMARERHPSVVVTEILISKIDGLTLSRRLRDDPATRDIPVVVFSILAAGSRASDAGARAFLRKPLVEAAFLATIQQALVSPPLVPTEQQ